MEEEFNLKLSANNLALICVFASLYAIFSSVSLFPIIGAAGKFITLASVMAPIIGLMLGPYLGVVAVSLGGLIGWYLNPVGPFGFFSFVPGAATAVFAGLLYNGKSAVSFSLYAMLLLAFILYPVIGPLWLYPYFFWFQLIGLIVLVSPLRSKARKSIHNPFHSFRLGFGVAIIAFTATLFGQVAGSLMFEIMNWPLLIPEIEAWRLNWQALTFTYPLERVIITLIATVIGTPLIKALGIYGFQIGGPKTDATLRSKHQAD